MEPASEVAPDPQTLYVIGSDFARDNDVALRRHIESGGRALLLVGRSAQCPLGITLAHVEVNTAAGRIAIPAWPEAAGLGLSDLRLRTNTPAWLVHGGAESAAHGLLGRVELGKGVAIALQADPGLLEADTKTYNRYTRWRQTRTLVQLLANLGASFEGDVTFFAPRNRQADTLSLAGEWHGKWTNRMDDPTGQAEHEDSGLTPAAKALLESTDPSPSNESWTAMKLPGTWESVAKGDWPNANGEAVLRKVFELPAEMAGREFILSLGAVDDRDVTTVNGTIVGQSPPGTQTQWNVKRLYRVPANIVRPGKNVVVVRVWDRFGGGGLTGTPEEVNISIAPDGRAIGLYHADYRTDFELGDDPFRYFRW